MGWRDRLRKQFQMVTAQLRFCINRSQRPQTRQFVLCFQPNIIRNILINKALGEDGQIVLGRQCASRFRRSYVKQVSKESHRAGAKVFTRKGRALLKHEAESSQMHSYSLRHMYCSWSGIFYLIGKIPPTVFIHVSAQSDRAIRTPRNRCSCSQSLITNNTQFQYCKRLTLPVIQGRLAYR